MDPMGSYSWWVFFSTHFKKITLIIIFPRIFLGQQKSVQNHHLDPEEVVYPKDLGPMEGFEPV